jgi:3-deoxy-D-manno-octulosonic-acid transferase
MSLVADFFYALIVLLLSPIWLTRMIRTGKIRTDWRGRCGHCDVPDGSPGQGAAGGGGGGSGGRVLLHAVSVGEVNALRTLVPLLRDEVELVIATTTDTGFARAQALFGSEYAVVRYPFDFSWMVRRFLKRVQPDAVGLIELEVWPNFMRACQRRNIRVAVINGRLSERSFGNYRKLRPLVAGTFRRLALAAVQDEAYAERFRALGVADELVRVTGSMKWDNAIITDVVEGAEALAREMGIDLTRPLVVAGSTAPDETTLIAAAVPEGVQLLVAPRKPEHFDQAARDLGGPRRRSQPDQPGCPDRFLLDTIGELRAAYSLADVAVVGRSFGDLYGSDMTEPIAVGAATIIGPAVSDFAQMFAAFHAAGGIVQTDREQLAEAVARLLADEGERRGLVERGRSVIRSQQGASRRHAELLLELAGSGPSRPGKEPT